MGKSELRGSKAKQEVQVNPCLLSSNKSRPHHCTRTKPGNTKPWQHTTLATHYPGNILPWQHTTLATQTTQNEPSLMFPAQHDTVLHRPQSLPATKARIYFKNTYIRATEIVAPTNTYLRMTSRHM